MSVLGLGKLSLSQPSIAKNRTLDDVRLFENDFHCNGIEMELDEFDRYMAFDRQVSPPRSPSACVSQQRKKNQVCVFCKNNGETLSVYGNHTLKDVNNRTVCPILRRYTCPKCGATGDSAHTIKYCPVSVLDPYNSILLLRTPRISTGRQRLSSSSRIDAPLDPELCSERTQN